MWQRRNGAYSFRLLRLRLRLRSIGWNNELTNDVFQACVSRDGLSVVAFPSFETFGEVHRGLNSFPLEIQLVNAALRYHLTWQDLFNRVEGAKGDETHSV